MKKEEENTTSSPMGLNTFFLLVGIGLLIYGGSIYAEYGRGPWGSMIAGLALVVNGIRGLGKQESPNNNE